MKFPYEIELEFISASRASPAHMNRSTETRLESLGEREIEIRVLPNFHECFYNSM